MPASADIARALRRAEFAALAALAALLILGLAAPAHAAILFHEDFLSANPTTGLPPGWMKLPVAHAPFFTTTRDTGIYGDASPALRVDLPLQTMNYYIASPVVHLSDLSADYTLSVSMRCEQPDAQFAVELLLRDAGGTMIESRRVIDIPGEMQDTLRTYRISFHVAGRREPGTCAIAFGLPYTKVLRGGRFWVDDVELRTGREVETLDAYVRPWTVSAGESIDLCISAGRGQADVDVFLEAASPTPMMPTLRLTGLSEQPVPDEVWRNGCGWPASTTLTIPADWPSGLYRVRVDDGDRPATATFIVRGQGDEGSVLVVLPTHTEQAYNSWGGHSFYTGPPSPEISLERPVLSSASGAYMAPIALLRWLWRENIGHGVAGDDDLNDDPHLLDGYAGVIIPGHSEYWTRAMRSSIERFIDAGGSVICLSGNTCWWQTRVEYNPSPAGGDSGRRLVGYKYQAADDPYWDIDSTYVTTRWDEPPLRDSETHFLGLSFRYGGHVNYGVAYNCPCPYDWLSGYGGYTVYRTDHWVFANTGLSEGDTLGQPLAIVGYEVDGTPIEWVEGRPQVLPEGGTPSHFVVLGQSPCWNYLTDPNGTGVALMGIMEQGENFIFNGGTTGWCWGLAGDPLVQQVTRNLIDRLERRPSPKPLTLTPYVHPNPCHENVAIEFSRASGEEEVIVFDATGRLVRRCPLQWLSPLRNGATWDLRDARGVLVPSGLYYARGHDRKASRIVLVR